MSFVNQIVVTTAVAEFCQQLEHRLAKDGEFVNCLLQTDWKTFSKRMSYWQKCLLAETREELEWLDTFIAVQAKAKAKAEAKAKAQEKAAQAQEKAAKAKAVKKAVKLEQTETRVIRGGRLDWDADEITTQSGTVVPPTTKPIVSLYPRVARPKGDHLAKFTKFAVRKNDKRPACKWKNPENHTKTSLDPDYRNTGIPTGPANNLLVVDVDVKDEGVAEFLTYVREHGNPDTFTVATPSGGFHYYFNYSSATEDDNVLIKANLKNAIKY